MNKSLWLVRLLSTHGKLSKQEILDAWRSEDERWSYEYRLTAQGLLTAPMVRS